MVTKIRPHHFVGRLVRENPQNTSPSGMHGQSLNRKTWVGKKGSQENCNYRSVKKNKTDHANDIVLSQQIFLTFQQALYDLYVSFLLCPELTVVSEFKKTNYLPNDGKEDRVQSWLFRFEQRDNTVDFVFANFLRDAGQLSMQFFPAFIFNSVDSTRLS